MGGGVHAQQTDSIVGASSDLVLPMMRPMVCKQQVGNDTLPKTEFHLSMGTAIVGNRYNSASVFGITPQFVYRPNDRLTVKGSLSLINSYSLYGGNSASYVRGHQPRDLAPRRNPGGEMAGAIDVAATYRVNDNLIIGASIFHIGGQLASSTLVNPWCPPVSPIELNATAVTAAMRYKFKNDSYLDFRATFINDRTGAFGPLFFGGPYGSPMYYDATTFGSHLF